MNKWLKRLGFVLGLGLLAQHGDFVDVVVGQFKAIQQPAADVIARTIAPEAHAATQGQWIEGRVVSVADGDTITVDTGNERVKIRLLAIDAPETGCKEKQRDCKKRAQQYGEESSAALSRAVLKETVKVRLNGESTYDRQVGTVYVKGQDLNYALVHEGYAWHYSKFARQQPGNEAAQYASAEAQARAARKGLWGKPNPVAPWEWRKGR